jgi:hypothetical protein
MPRAISCSAKLSPRHAKVSWSPPSNSSFRNAARHPRRQRRPLRQPKRTFNLSKLSVWWLRRGITKPAAQYRPARSHLPQHDREVLVTARGRICMHRKRLNISTVLAGQRLGIKEVDDGIWIVSFMHYDLGFIDLEQKTLQPLDNPFGTELSPMS